MDVTIALTKDEVATLDRAVKYAIGNAQRGLGNVRHRLTAAKQYGREPDPAEVANEAYQTDELDRLHELQKRLRALNVDG